MCTVATRTVCTVAVRSLTASSTYCNTHDTNNRMDMMIHRQFWHVENNSQCSVRWESFYCLEEQHLQGQHPLNLSLVLPERAARPDSVPFLLGLAVRLALHSSYSQVFPPPEPTNMPTSRPKMLKIVILGESGYVASKPATSLTPERANAKEEQGNHLRRTYLKNMPLTDCVSCPYKNEQSRKDVVDGTVRRTSIQPSI